MNHSIHKIGFWSGLDEVRILQQTPHSLFWDFDALGYIFMALATLMAIPVFDRRRLHKWVRVSFYRQRDSDAANYDRLFLPAILIQVINTRFPLGNYSPGLHADTGNNVYEVFKKGSANCLMWQLLPEVSICPCTGNST